VPRGYVGVGVQAQARRSPPGGIGDDGLLLALLLLLFSLSLLGGIGGKGEDLGVARVLEAQRLGLLIRAALRLGCVGAAAMLGFRATDTRHASGGCGSGARVFGGA
jgi:hypothetical protein